MKTFEKYPTLPVNRRPLKKIGVVRRVFAKVGNHRMHAATTANPQDLDGDIPNMNVGRALLIIVLLHVVCIGGIFLRKKIANAEAARHATTEASLVVESAPAPVATTTQTITSVQDLPPIQTGDRSHMVTTGDTYDSVAAKMGVTEQSLRAANSDTDLIPGLVLRVPPRTVEAIVSEDIARFQETPSTVVDPVVPAPQSPAAVLVRPMLNLDAAPRATTVVEEAPSTNSAVTTSGTTHTVRAGETLYAIARRHGVSVNALMQANGISNASGLQIGARLNIPK